jgi:3-isopropylmalate dehydrogenase
MVGKTKIQKNLQLLILEGDGIGPEICREAVKVLNVLDRKYALNLEIIIENVGLKSLETVGSTLPEHVVELARGVDGIVMGPMSTNEYPNENNGGINPSGTIRKKLDLFANVRPAKSYFRSLGLDRAEIDLVIVRENTEGFYSDRSMYIGSGEFMPTEDLAVSVRKITRSASIRIAKVAFELAQARSKRLTAVHKSNVFRLSDGLFLESVRDVKNNYPDIDYSEQIVDAMAARLVRDPENFDVLVTTNMFGDILSDEASELAGGLGLASSINYGTQNAMAQAQHGSAPEIAGQNVANPTALIGSIAMLFNWLGMMRRDPTLEEAAHSIENALTHLMSNVDARTRDLGGRNSTSGFGCGVAAYLDRQS